ncbi:energy-coupling factor ABC transporter ATP-binding protein [Treponema sp. UBA7567]|uniref:energy-coupling factor ABC transporter ATP-binding protein n=3 Tax=unclassified Treponema TaxID=2638727 RepID=UPI0025EC521D|nr:ABC transporter ATP-binding protein [Treponema sp. UBA7567]
MNKIVIDSITKIYTTSEGNKTALNNVSFQIDEGSVTVIGGENGSGKSVLMNIIAGLEKPTSGKIYSFAEAGLVFQEADTQILGETPREDISFGPKNQKKSKIQVEQAVENSLEQVGLTKKADYPARFLSGGEKRRLAVACMLAMELPVIIFDEPYANLDYGGVKQVNALIKRLHEQKKTVIILTHELEKCLGLADKFVVLFRGDKVFDGTAREGLLQKLEQWNIRNPLNAYSKLEDLVWL